MDRIKEILAQMSVEDLLETYKNAIVDSETKAEVLRFLIISELENRINK